MADLTDIQAAQTVKLVGSSPFGTESTPVKSSSNGDLGSSDIVDTTGLYGTITVGTSPVEVKVGASPLNSRKLLTLDNTSNTTFYWGYNNSITTSAFAGRIFKDQQASWAVGPNVSIWIVAGSAGNSAHVSEGA